MEDGCPSNRPKGAAGDVLQGCRSLEMREVGVRERCGIRRRRQEPPGLGEEIETESSRLQQVQLVCPPDRFGAVTDTQLPVGVRDVTLDGGEADEELIGNFLVPHSRRDET